MALSMKTIRASSRILKQHPSLPLKTVNLNPPYPPRLSPHLPLSAPPHHGFHTSTNLRSAFFNLGGLSTSRENRYLSKEKGIPRTEFSPHLELIRSSEVDTQRIPASSKPSSTPNTENSTSTLGKDLADGYGSKDSSTIPKADHDALKARITELKQELRDSKVTARHHFKLYKERSGGMIFLGGLCVLLSTYIIFEEEMIELFNWTILHVPFLGRILPEGATAGERRSKAVRKDPYNEDIRKILDATPRGKARRPRSRQDEQSRRPWTPARLLWVADD